MVIEYTPIGIIRSPFKHVRGMPIQPAAAEGVEGRVEIFDEYCPGLKDIDGFSHIILIYHFHLSTGYSPHAKPFLDSVERGIFAIRSPARPNPIGMSVVRLVKVEGCTLFIEDVDIVDETPLLDIKPFVPEFDSRPAESIGWLADRVNDLKKKRSD